MDLKPLFYPSSIAVIGASEKSASVGGSVFKNLLNQGYQGKLYPVNPKAEAVFGVRCYKNIKEINDQIDLAVVVIPAAFVPGVMKEIAEKGIKAVIIISAGFKETGNDGANLENEIKEICQENKIALIGPNCLGVINPEIKMNATFANIMPAQGNVAFLSQSGALCSSVLDYAKGLNIGFSKFVSIGNKACLDEMALVEYLGNDEKTKVILMYVESMVDSQKIIKTAKAIIQSKNPKPIIVLKSGRTQAGADASSSHTGALGGDDSLYNALFSQSGIIRANTIEDLFNLAVIFSNNKLTSGKNMAIITNAGGPGVITTDEVVYRGLEMAKLDKKTVENLKIYLPATANFNNPVDVIGDAKADRYQKALEYVLKDNNVDGVIVVLTPQAMTEIEKTAAIIVEAKKTTKKPIIASFMGTTTVEPGLRIMRDGHVATSQFPDDAVRSMAAMVKYSENTKKICSTNFNFSDVDKGKVTEIMNQAKSKSQTYFPEAEARDIISAYGLPLLKSQVATSADEAKKIAQDFNCSMAFKIVSKDIIHKTDVGGVMLNVKPAEADESYRKMIETVTKNTPKARIDGVLIMEMAANDGVEVVLGVKKDPSLGHAIMFGLGGIYVEILKDVVFRIAPVNVCDAKEMVQGIRSAKIFEGARGREVLDMEKTVECIGRLSQLLSDFPQIKELDMNPIIVLPKGRGVRVLDVRMVI